MFENYTKIDKLLQHSSLQKALFNTVDKFLQKSSVWRYPASQNNTTLANSFADYFTKKIEKIHQSPFLRKDKINEHTTLKPSTESSKSFCVFEEVTEDQTVVFAGKPSKRSRDF